MYTRRRSRLCSTATPGEMEKCIGRPGAGGCRPCPASSNQRMMAHAGKSCLCDAHSQSSESIGCKVAPSGSDGKDRHAESLHLSVVPGLQLRQVDLNLLVVFAVFAEERSVSRAAQRLLLSQPATSRALQRLRDTFYDDLSIRTATGYELTLHAQRLLQELEIMLPKIDRLLTTRHFVPSEEEATFRVVGTDSSASTLAPLICRKVLPSGAKVRFEYVQWHKESFEELARGSVDLVIAADVVEVPAGVRNRKRSKRRRACVFS